MAVFFIHGAPCSGKSTYVKEHLKRGDIVCDVDELYTAISQNEQHDAELYAHKVACELFNHLLDIVRDRKGNWKNAYVISTANTTEQVEEMKERIHADEAVFVDTPFEVCMERAENRPFYFQWIIEEWFATMNLKR